MKETTIMTRNHLARSATQQHIQQTPPPQQQQQPTVQHLQTKWSIKERLFLVSCVLINGESNWTFISDQLNKWMKHTYSYIHNYWYTYSFKAIYEIYTYQSHSILHQHMQQ